MRSFSAAVWVAVCSAAFLTACAPRIGVGIPVGPLNVGVGLGAGGISAGVGTGVGPLGVGVGVQPNGQISGHAGVGASVPLGGARVGAGIGGSTVLHSPVPGGHAPAPVAAPAAPARTVVPAPRQWRDAYGNLVPQCRVMGDC